MTVNSPRAREPAQAEVPSPSAELGIRLGYAWPPVRAKWRISPDQMEYMTMTGGVLGSLATGIFGAVLTLWVAPGRTGLAQAELIMAAAAASAIAAGRRSRAAAPARAEHG